MSLMLTYDYIRNFTEIKLTSETPGDCETKSFFVTPMIELMVKLPYDMVKQELFEYLTVHDLGRLDNMCMNMNH